MAFEVTEADRLLSRGALGRSEKGLLALAAIALALGFAAWITDAGQGGAFQGGPLASVALPTAQNDVQDQVSFHDRFLGAPTRAGEAVGSTLKALDRAAINNLEGKLWDAKALLARQLMYSNSRSASAFASTSLHDFVPSAGANDIRTSVSGDDLRSAAVAPTGIPLPRP